jgi:hypothetical protein
METAFWRDWLGLVKWGWQGEGSFGVNNVEKKIRQITSEGVRNVIFALCY